MGRAKHLWSIYQKMQRSSSATFEQIHDAIGVPRDHPTAWRLLPGARRRALALDADPGPLQGLHRAAQAATCTSRCTPR